MLPLGRLRLTGFMAYEVLAALRAHLTPSPHVEHTHTQAHTPICFSDLFALQLRPLPTPYTTINTHCRPAGRCHVYRWCPCCVSAHTGTAQCHSAGLAWGSGCHRLCQECSHVSHIFPLWFHYLEIVWPKLTPATSIRSSSSTAA